jgi:hypothetical protein
MDEIFDSTRVKILTLLVHRYPLDEIAEVLDINTHILEIQVEIIASLIGDFMPAQCLPCDTAYH